MKLFSEGGALKHRQIHLRLFDRAAYFRRGPLADPTMADAADPAPTTAPPRARPSARSLLPLTLTTIGVVYGDIGTSPLYTIRECFFGTHSVPPTHENVLGVLSLVIYALVIVISIKYIAIVMRADNAGEGGILALTALVPTGGSGNGRNVLIALGIFGAALLYGDGMITPAITVLGAVEGLKVATPFFDSYVVPLTVVILIGIFAIQRHGTHLVGRLFGPVMVLWFLAIAVLGVSWIVGSPSSSPPINPIHAITFFETNGLHGFAVLGAVFLAVTGGEALYADMGHFGKRPIRFAWFALVLPALLLNYFGQGALLLIDSTAAEQPFFLLAPSWALLPMVGLATAAAIIASQALISGAFSHHPTGRPAWLQPADGHRPHLVAPHGADLRAAGELGADGGHDRDRPRLPIVERARRRVRHRRHADDGDHRSAAARDRHGALEVAARRRAAGDRRVPVDRSGVPRREPVENRPRRLAAAGHRERAVYDDDDVEDRAAPGGRTADGARPAAGAVRGDDGGPSSRSACLARAVFMTAQPRGTPPALVHNLRHNKVLHERVIILSVQTTHTPHVTPDERLSIAPLGWRSVQRRVALRVHGRAECPRGAGARTRAGPGDRY